MKSLSPVGGLSSGCTARCGADGRVLVGPFLLTTEGSFGGPCGCLSLCRVVVLGNDFPPRCFFLFHNFSIMGVRLRLNLRNLGLPELGPATGWRVSSIVGCG